MRVELSHALLKCLSKLTQVHSIKEVFLGIGRDVDFVDASCRAAEEETFRAKWVRRPDGKSFQKRSNLRLGGGQRVEENLGNPLHDCDGELNSVTRGRAPFEVKGLGYAAQGYVTHSG